MGLAISISKKLELQIKVNQKLQKNGNEKNNQVYNEVRKGSNNEK